MKNVRTQEQMFKEVSKKLRIVGLKGWFAVSGYADYRLQSKQMKNIFTKCNNYEQANELGQYIVRYGYEGLYNDSYRYCAESIRDELKANSKEGKPFLYVGVRSYALKIGKTKEDMLDCTYIEDIDTFKKELTSPKVDIPTMDWKNISLYSPRYLLGKDVHLKDGRYGYDSRWYSGRVTNYSYTNRGLVLRVGSHNIQTLPDTQVHVADNR